MSTETHTDGVAIVPKPQQDARLDRKSEPDSTRAATPPAGDFHVRSHGLARSLVWLLCILVIVLFIITFTVQPFRIPSGSMEPTLMVGDFLLLVKQDFPAAQGISPLPSAQINRRDIIVFHYPLDPSVYLVKRVIGIPGDHLKLRNNRVLIDGHPLQESYAVYTPGPADSFRDNFPRLQTPDPSVDSNWWILMKSLVDHGELTVPPGQYFVLGDNRNDSEDSRYWGFVPAAAIVGRPLLIYFSLNQEDSNQQDQEDNPDKPAVRQQKAGRWSAMSRFARWDRTLRVVH